MIPGTEVWIEAKVYYTIYFDDDDLGYESPRASYGNGHWRKRIEDLVFDCSTKLLRLLPDGTPVAGLLLGFEIENLPKRLRVYNPSPTEIDKFIWSEMNAQLPQRRICPLSSSGGWPRTLPVAPQYRFVTRPMLLMP